MNEKEIKQIWDNLLNKLNETEKTYLAIISSEKNKEIERYKKIAEETVQRDEYLYTIKDIEVRDKEIEKLNNIINKKEQFLGDNIKRLEREVVKRDNIINEIYMFLSQYTITHTWQKIVIEDTIKYIEELKGSNSNETL